MYIFQKTHNHRDVGEREPVDLRPDGEVAAEEVPLLRLVLHRLAVVQPLHVLLLPLLPKVDEEKYVMRSVNLHIQILHSLSSSHANLATRTLLLRNESFQPMHVTSHLKYFYCKFTSGIPL